MAKRRRQTKARGASRRRITNREEAAVMDPVLPPLPDEVAEDIFVRLPIKSLAASRCVSPSWNGLISSPIFARLHREAAAARAVVAPRFVSVPVESDAHTHLRVALPWETNPLPSRCAGCPRVFSGAGGACRGAVLVGRPCDGEFYLCNPSTGGALLLPPRRPPWYFHSAGLGYDDGQGRHKAVLFEFAWGHPPPRWWFSRLQCSIVTVGSSGGQWRWRAPRGRRTPIICEDAIVTASMGPVFADGRLHWMLLSRKGNGTNGVLSFEMGSESFRRLPLPPFTNDENIPRLERATMAEVDGRLCLVRDLRRPLRAVAVFEVWMLRDYNSLSWSLDRRINLTPYIGKELTMPWDDDFFVVCYARGGCSGESRKILLATNGTVQRAYMYQPHTGELHIVVRRNDNVVQQGMSLSRKRQHIRLVLYQESLLQIDGMEFGNKDIKFSFTDQSIGSGSNRVPVIQQND